MSVQRCPRCKGEGSVTVTYDDYGMADPKDVMCPVCGGNRFVSPATREAQRSGSVPTSTDGEHQALIEVRQQLQQVEQERDKLQSATEGLATLGVRLNAKKERVEAELIAIKAVAGTLIDALKAFVAADEEHASHEGFSDACWSLLDQSRAAILTAESSLRARPETTETPT